MNRLKLLFVLFVLTGFTALMAQTVTIKGTVTSADDGLPIPSATVTVKGATIGTLTDVDGKYTLNVPVSVDILVFKFVGMKTVEETIGGRTTINITMATDMLGLDEVVVTALGITREKKALGYSVTEVKGDAVANAKETNIVNALQGMAPGVQITKASGAIGSSAQIVIRGIKSFGDNEPLWVIDGTPISNASSGATQWSGVDYGNNASDIDPENIESVSILKGANAAALYGSRARNGVVLVTTKKGQAGKVKTSISNSTSFDRISFLPTYQNKYGQGSGGSEFNFHQRTTDPADPTFGYDYQTFAETQSFTYADGMGGGVFDYFDASWGPRLDAGLNLAQFDSPYNSVTGTYTPTPWVSHPNNIRDFFVTGITSTTSLSVSGGNDNLTGRLGYSNTYQTGIIPNTDQKKNDINLSTTAKLSSKLKVDVNLNYAYTQNDNLPGQGYSSQNVMESIGGWFGRQINMQSLKDNWKKWGPNGLPYNWNSNYHNNPYWTVHNTNARRRDRIYGNAVATYEIFDWLNLVGRYGLDYYSETRKTSVFEGSNDAPVGTGGYFNTSTRYNSEVNADIFLNFQKDFYGSALQVSGNIGANYRGTNYKYSYLGVTQLTVPNWFDISNVNGSVEPDMYQSERKSNSIFGSINIGYKSQVFFDYTLRKDWSSTLPPSNWAYSYPSYSLGWIFTETFGIAKDILSYGKLRASYAKVGSDTGPYQLYPVHTSVTPSYDGISMFEYPTEIFPANLKPEQTKSLELGVEFKFFNNRLGTDISYYDMLTSNQIMIVDVSTSSGFLNKAINAGEIETSGIEIALYGDPIKKQDFTWTVTVNWSKSKTQVNKLYSGVDSYVLDSSWSPTTIEARPGQPYGQIYGVAYQRNESGNLLTKGGYYQGTPKPYVVCGNTQPDWVGSIRNSFKYKKLSAEILIDAKWGGDIFSVTKWFGDQSGITEASVKNNCRETGVIAKGIDIDTNEPNTIAVEPEVWFGAEWGKTEPAVIDGSYVKLREISIGYDLKIKSNYISNLNVGIYSRNVAVLYLDKSNDIRIDPETAYGTGTNAVGIEQYQLPPVRSMGFKLRVDF
jgi:TonB-linked SusC/RagA family outer membrane protein